jgi:hypothetical protein
MTPQPQQPESFLSLTFDEYGAFKMLLEDDGDHANELLMMLEVSRTSRPAPSPETITKELALELCMDARKDAAAQAREEIRS